MTFPLIAVDIGNNRLKFGRFAPAPPIPNPQSPIPYSLPEPSAALQLAGADADLDRLAAWLAQSPGDVGDWWIASVNRPSATRLIDWLRTHRPDDRITLLAAGDLPLEVAVPRPDMVGIDRLLDAWGADRLRRSDRPAVVVDVGTAITVDLVSAEGVFLGGAILPGIAMAARAMHTFTDLLPLIDASELTAPPPPVGTATEPAMRSGLFWGAVGAIRQLVERMAADAGGQPEIFLTGGAGPAVADLLGPQAQHVPHLTLGAITLVAGIRPTERHS